MRLKNLIEQELEAYNDEVTDIIKSSDTVDEAIATIFDTLRHPQDIDHEEIEEDIREFYAIIHTGEYYEK
tara:strand:+ start:284 stop:493 length:210 start_codon:yes stop_codon:yes gene_type:complete